MQITVNGSSRQVPAALTVAALLAELAVEPRYVAVEVNQELVPRARHRDWKLADGDQLEVVTLVGGG